MRSLSWIGMAALLLLTAAACINQMKAKMPVVKYDEAQKAPVAKDRAKPEDVTLEQQQSNADYNREGYAHIVENRFLATQQDPLSTFSIDVDAAAYSNIRRFISGGELPPAGAVRIEEMINYFDYQYPQPSKGEPFSVNTELSACPWNPDHRMVLIGLQGESSSNGQLPAANLVFLIDVSGSMDEPNKLPLVKTSLKMLTDQLRDEDHVAIVVYAGNAGLVLPSTSGRQKETIKKAIDQLGAGGSTAGGEGLALAYNVAEKNFIKGGNNRIILATDGDFNVGPSSDDELVSLIEQQRKTGVFLSVLGFGMDKVEFNPARVQAYRLIGYENRALAAEDFNDDRKDAGELGSFPVCLGRSGVRTIAAPFGVQGAIGLGAGDNHGKRCERIG